MPEINLSITGQQFLYILILTLIVGYIINRIISYVEKFDISTLHLEIGSVLEKCYDLFPIESFNFKGEVFKRGMKVKVFTADSKNFEGELIGANSANIICVMTKRCIITSEIHHIKAIQHIKETL